MKTLKQILDEADLNELATRLNCSPDYLRKLARGDRPVGARILARAAAIFPDLDTRETLRVMRADDFQTEAADAA